MGRRRRLEIGASCGAFAVAALVLVTASDTEPPPDVVAAEGCTLPLDDCPTTTAPETSTTTTPGGMILQGSDGSLTVEARVEPSAIHTGDLVRVHLRATDIPGSIIVSGADYGDGSLGSSPAGPYLECDPDAPPTDGPSAERTWTVEYSYRLPGRYSLQLFITSSSCGAEGSRGVELTAALEIARGALLGNGPVALGLELTQLQPIDDEDPKAVVLNAAAFDGDGWVKRISVDWGDGSPPWVFDRPLSECTDPITFFPGPSNVAKAELHKYAAPGPYEVLATAESVACDGSNSQTAAANLVVIAP